MKKQAILDRLNELIVEEKGKPVKIDQHFRDSELDSLGTTLVLAMLESEFPIFKDIPETEDAFATLDLKNLTVRDLIIKCKLSITDTCTGQSPGMAT